MKTSNLKNRTAPRAASLRSLRVGETIDPDRNHPCAGMTPIVDGSLCIAWVTEFGGGEEVAKLIVAALAKGGAS